MPMLTSMQFGQVHPGTNTLIPGAGGAMSGPNHLSGALSGWPAWAQQTFMGQGQGQGQGQAQAPPQAQPAGHGGPAPGALGSALGQPAQPQGQPGARQASPWAQFFGQPAYMRQAELHNADKQLGAQSGESFGWGGHSGGYFQF